MRETGWEERGPKAHSKNSDFVVPLRFSQGAAKSRRTKRGIHKRGIHEKAKFPLF